MPNYDFSLNMETDNSNSLILRNVKPNSTILEFGPAYGRMTKYLKEQLNCKVFIVEYDEKAGASAKQYADDDWIGPELGDAEKDWWHHECGNVKFDYIIFADVLEHLHDPQKVLSRAVTHLADDGSILVSIPNIGHNSVLIDLLQGKFEYRDFGILDKTHLKFFTHESLRNMVAVCGLSAVKEMNAINTVSGTEFGNSYDQVPSEVSKYLQSRKHGEVYQFVWELKRTNIEVSIVTPVYNKWNFTKSYLEDLLKLDGAKVEIIVVDNASTDETSKTIKEYEAKANNLKVIRNDTNVGFGKACNIGYNASQGKYVVFLNNDIRVRDNFNTWVHDLVAKCTDNNLVSPTGGKVDPANDFQFMYETTDPAKDINYLSGWCIAAKREVWNKFIEENSVYKGPFSEQYFCYFEDTHLSFVAREKGIQLHMASAPVTHFGKVSSKQLNTYGLYKASRDTFIKNWKQK
jgi:GT2 family glycosyltransferase/2-polyprenyl-3-methyl-5-hydroxy-6-metoxy-1,4-benzoquinol methylase